MLTFWARRKMIIRNTDYSKSKLKRTQCTKEKEINKRIVVLISMYIAIIIVIDALPLSGLEQTAESFVTCWILKGSCIVHTNSLLILSNLKTVIFLLLLEN